MMVLQAGTPLTFAEVKDYIARSIDVIVQLGREDGAHSGHIRPVIPI